ncbi:MAG: tRNA (adenine(22)-N(1))-methyltransferase [Blautia sp.]
MKDRKKIQLSKRLETVASFVEAGSRIADVGCDHGYIPIYLMEKGIIPGAIAMDVNQGPLMRASAHIQEYGLGEYITTRLSDGVKALKPGEADGVVIAGMGGPLMEKILTEGKEVLDTVSYMILQPQSEIARFRRFLHSAGYGIVGEEMVLEDGKYYPMMKVVHKEQKYEREIQYLYGYELLRTKHPVLHQFLLKEKESRERVRSHLEQAGTQGAACRLQELEQEYRLIEEALKEYEM